MASKIDLKAFFKRKAAGSEGPVAKNQIANPEMIVPVNDYHAWYHLDTICFDVKSRLSLQQHTKTYSN